MMFGLPPMQGCEESRRMMPKQFTSCPVLSKHREMMKPMTLTVKMTMMMMVIVHMKLLDFCLTDYTQFP